MTIFKPRNSPSRTRFRTAALDLILDHFRPHNVVKITERHIREYFECPDRTRKFVQAAIWPRLTPPTPSTILTWMDELNMRSATIRTFRDYEKHRGRMTHKTRHAYERAIIARDPYRHSIKEWTRRYPAVSESTIHKIRRDYTSRLST